MSAVDGTERGSHSRPKSEPSWPAALCVVGCAAMNYALPDRFTLGPNWLFPALEMVILVPLFVRAPRRLPREPKGQQVAATILVSLVTLANVISLYALIHTLLFRPKDLSGEQLLFSAVAIWVTNVLVFGLWFWELDRGGPDDRLRATHGPPDFLFPQMSSPRWAPDDWTPTFFDYLYVSFTNATAFSPTDTMPLSIMAKALMTIESAASLATIAIVASRAVNIIG